MQTNSINIDASAFYQQTSLSVQTTDTIQKSVGKIEQQALKTENTSTQLLSQNTQDRYNKISSTTESSYSESTQGDQKIEERTTTERTVSKKERGNLLNLYA